MEIVVNDTNILIDLYNAGLMTYCQYLHLDFRTLDVVMNEIEVKEQINAVQKLVDDGFLKVYSLSSEQMQKVLHKIGEYQGICNLSLEDISVMVYAQDNNCRLLTGDKTLRDKATIENIKVSGILYLTDLMTSQGVVSNSQMRTALQLLLDSNNRLPKKLIKERMEKLK